MCDFPFPEESFTPSSLDTPSMFAIFFTKGLFLKFVSSPNLLISWMYLLINSALEEMLSVFEFSSSTVY